MDSTKGYSIAVIYFSLGFLLGSVFTSGDSELRELQIERTKLEIKILKAEQ